MKKVLFVTLCLLSFAANSPAHAQRIDKILEAFRVQIGHTRFDHPKLDSYDALPPGISYGISVDLRRPTPSLPLAFSLYHDYAYYVNGLVDSSYYSRSLQAFGIEARVYLPSSLHLRYQPYAGAGIGRYQLTDNFVGPFYSDKDIRSRTRQGTKVIAGVESVYHLFVEASYTTPGVSSQNGSLLSIGFRL